MSDRYACRSRRLASRLVVCATLALAVPVDAQERTGAFEYRANTDPLTDQDESSVLTTELEPTLLRGAALAWRCDGQEAIELVISAGEFLNSSSPVTVRWRFDQAPASEERRWNPSTTGTAAFAPSEDVVTFTRDARPASAVLVRLRDFRGVEHDLRFSLVGLTDALERLPCSKALTAPPLPPPPSLAQTDPAAQPTRTPFTVAPALQNVAEIQRALVDEYPMVLRDSGIGGRVLVWVFIDEEGRVQQIQINESSGYEALDQAALRVAEVFRFSPARNREEIVPAWVSVPITFSVR